MIKLIYKVDFRRSGDPTDGHGEKMVRVRFNYSAVIGDPTDDNG